MKTEGKSLVSSVRPPPPPPLPDLNFPHTTPRLEFLPHGYKEKVVNMDEGRTAIVERKGHQYYVVDQDYSRGDRRSDGPAMANFFVVVGGLTTENNVRESNRLKKGWNWHQQ